MSKRKSQQERERQRAAWLRRQRRRQGADQVALVTVEPEPTTVVTENERPELWVFGGGEWKLLDADHNVVFAMDERWAPHYLVADEMTLTDKDSNVVGRCSTEYAAWIGRQKT
jgi:hypothetical protein